MICFQIQEIKLDQMSLWIIWVSALFQWEKVTHLNKKCGSAVILQDDPSCAGFDYSFDNYRYDDVCYVNLIFVKILLFTQPHRLYPKNTPIYQF